MGSFAWISSRPLPRRFDLRAQGWRLAEDGRPGGICAGLVDTEGGVAPESFAPGLRRRALALALPCTRERARWLSAGFADALALDAELGEIEQRALRIVGGAGGGGGAVDPTRRHAGRLTLDLVERDARCDGRRLRLHPREFDLLWRLREADGEPVPGKVLLRDVWQLRHLPETNSLAVHVHRLRRKLAAAGLDGMIVTEGGGYRLLVGGEEKPLDATTRLRELNALASAEQSA